MNTPKPELRKIAEIAIKQKESVLESKKGGYSPSLHSLYQDVLPALRKKYDGADARDAIFLLGYLHAWTNGTSANEYYMWAFPTVKQLREDTGIHGDRINPLCTILEDEGLLITRQMPWKGNVKKFYLPLYFPADIARREPEPPVTTVEETPQEERSTNGEMTPEEIANWL